MLTPVWQHRTQWLKGGTTPEPIGRWTLHKLRCAHVIQPLEGEETLPHAAGWMNLRNMMRSKGPDTRGHVCTSVHVICPWHIRLQTGEWQGAVDRHWVLFHQKCFGTRQRWWLHNTVNILNATKWFTLKWLILCGVTFTSIKKIRLGNNKDW